MAFCGFDESAALFDSTPVENMFITEYMLRAPGDFVKVYIYALMLCYHNSERMSLTTMAKDLDMTEEEVERAFRYWARDGLVRQVGDNPVCFKLFNLKQLTLTRAQTPSEQLYNRDFADEVRRVLHRDELHPDEWRMIYDWIDVYELTEVVVIMLLDYEMKKSNGRVKIAIANETAIEWARSGINSVEDVDRFEYIEQERVKELRKLLRHMGYRHEPSEEEKKLYLKWVEDWGFESEAIIEACSEMTSGKPSMRFLDQILLRQHQMGNHTAVMLKTALAKEKADRDYMRDIFAALGRVGSVPTSADAQIVEKWKASNLSAEFVKMAAEKVHRERNDNSIDAVDKYLTLCIKANITTVAAMQANDLRIEMLNEQLGEIYQAAGMEKKAAAADRKQLETWLGLPGISFEHILLAAEYAKGSGAPMRLINKILSDWQRAGISTLEAARAEHEAHVRNTSQGGARSIPAVQQDVMQRHAYTDADYRRMVIDLDEEEN